MFAQRACADPGIPGKIVVRSDCCVMAMMGTAKPGDGSQCDTTLQRCRSSKEYNRIGTALVRIPRQVSRIRKLGLPAIAAAGKDA